MIEYELLDSDPKLPKLKRNTGKYLTQSKRGRILHIVNILRKDNKMANGKIKKLQNLKQGLFVAWLIEAIFRGFVGWVLLTNFTHLATTVAGVYALVTAGAIVVFHFWNASK